MMPLSETSMRLFCFTLDVPAAVAVFRKKKKNALRRRILVAITVIYDPKIHPRKARSQGRKYVKKILGDSTL